jgi:hypothetical protein
MVVSRHQNVGQNLIVLIANKAFRNVTKLGYLGRTTTTNQHFIHEEIKSRSYSGNALYHPHQCLLSPGHLCENLTIEIYKTIILPFVLYGCET